MRFYDYGPSQNCFKVRLLAAHLGVALQIVPVSIFKVRQHLRSSWPRIPRAPCPCSRLIQGNALRSRMQS
jgi:hypothetical protein